MRANYLGDELQWKKYWDSLGPQKVGAYVFKH